jgi:hypothetical protein
MNRPHIAGSIIMALNLCVPVSQQSHGEDDVSTYQKNFLNWYLFNMIVVCQHFFLHGYNIG